MLRRWTRYLLTMVLAGSLVLTLLSATRIALDPTLTPLREASLAEVTATVERELARMSPAQSRAGSPRIWRQNRAIGLCCRRCTI
jgi:hypothetical protein